MDKRATEMLGLPVVALEGGKTLAHVEDFIVDPLRKQALAVVIGEPGFRRSARAIPFGRLTANGPDAVIVPNDKIALAIERDPVLKQLDNGQTVLDARVMTNDGRELGTITDMVLDDHTGEIKGYDVRADDGATRWLPVETVLSLGQKMVMVTAATATLFEAQAAAPPSPASTSASSSAATEGDADVAADAPSVVIRPISARRKAVAATTEGNTADVTAEVDADADADADNARKDGSPGAMLEDALAGALDFGNLANMGGTALNNTRLLFGIVLLVLGILILVNPALLPLIAGIALIVIGLWIALQNATGARS